MIFQKRPIIYVLLFLLSVLCLMCKKDLLKQVSVTTGTFTDTRDGKIYKTTTIGDYTWLAQNLDYDTDSSCYYNNDTLNTDYGRLYKWSAVLTAIPQGWHLPTYTELDFLCRNLGGYRAGCQMKETGNKHWAGDNSCANNLSELTILPGGEFVGSLNQFKYADSMAVFWETQQTYWFVSLYNEFSYSSDDQYYGSSNEAHPGDMYALRCVKDY